MTARARREEGVALILALAFITLIGVATAVLANLAFTSQTAAGVYTGNGRLVNALDSGVQAAIENARVAAALPFACPPDLDLPSVNAHHVKVTCEPVNPAAAPSTRAVLRFTAVEDGTPGCPAPRTTVQATVVFTTIGDTQTGARVARTSAWRVRPETVPAPPPVCPTP